MKTEKSEIIIAEEIIISKILNIRGKQVMLATDLAELYQVGTKALNQQVKRNAGKFPDRYMFQLTKEEWENIRFQVETLEPDNSLRPQIATLDLPQHPNLRSQFATSSLQALLV